MLNNQQFNEIRDIKQTTCFFLMKILYLLLKLIRVTILIQVETQRSLSEQRLQERLKRLQVLQRN